jgi:hypothetical protein
MIQAAGLKKDAVCCQVIELAQAKLLDMHNIQNKFSLVSNQAKLAVVDHILMLDFEVRRENVLLMEASLIASHMRTAFSVPEDLVYVRSGYPSEPIIAEAACRQLASWMEEKPSALLDILNENTSSGLISYGEIGELTGRALLWDAYRRAVQYDHPLAKEGINYSAGCLLTTFIKTLFLDEYADIILNSQPDNQNEGPTFREAFKEAKIRFTHFGKLGHDGDTTTYAAWAAFMRSMAISCRLGQPMLDCLVPILLWDRKLCEWVMSAILVQFKRRKKKGSIAECSIDENLIGFFPVANCSGCPNHTDSHPDSRPYITLVMEVGVQAPVPEKAATMTKSAGPKKSPSSKRKIASKKSGPSPAAQPISRRGKFRSAVKTPSTIVIPQPGTHHRRRSCHPRYSIFVYGCSSNVYRGIHEEQRGAFSLLLRSGDFLGEHARKGERSAAALLRMKPFWNRGKNSYDWINCPQLQGGPDYNEGVFLSNTEDDEDFLSEEDEERVTPTELEGGTSTFRSLRRVIGRIASS